MIHIASVHWRSADWIDIQLDHLRRHISEPFHVYAFLNDIPGSHRSKFHFSATEPIRDHATKLNLLARVIQSVSEDDRDLLIFLDGDAFPIANLLPPLRARLAQVRLVAVQRLENNGDRQPHPCFCATTVGFWKEIGGDWKEGHTWPDRRGHPTTDVGGNLLGILESRGISWDPLKRSNRKDLHPVWFGVYGDLIYHHGAGFRQDKISRADLDRLSESRLRASPIRRRAAQLADLLLAKSPVRTFRQFTEVHRASHRNAKLSEEVLQRIQRDDSFFTLLTT